MSQPAFITALLSLAAAAALSAAEPPDFDRDVAPILIDHCLGCHYPNKKSGELDLTSLKAALTGGEQGAALVPGKPAQSLLLQRIASGEMPPPGEKESRPLAAAQIATLTAWVAAGASWPERRELGIHEQSVNLDAARTFWSFQPVRRPEVPAIRTAQSALRNPVDVFILEKLTAAGLTLSPPAIRLQLLRRLSLDLRGLPPSLAEQEQFLADQAPDAYERLVDRLLADPAYGERWARHWLDLVRYADSNGYERDDPKPSVWRYRRLCDRRAQCRQAVRPVRRRADRRRRDGGRQPRDADCHRLSRLGAWQDEVDPLELPQYRADELDDMIRTTSQTFLGLTLGCARCHNHKFDPLTMVDYYSLSAILAPLKRPNKGRTDRDIPLGTPDEIAAIHARNDELAKLEAKILEVITQKPADADQQMAAIHARQRELWAKTPNRPGAYRCYEDSRDAPPTHLLLSGRASNPGPLMQARVPAVLAAANHRDDVMFAERGASTAAKLQSTGRRLALAQWLASPENPLTARVIVNRVWQHHLGTGIVATPSDFGHMGARPTHPELLDWLADWLAHDAQWSLKRLHRLVVMSQTYQQASRGDREQETGDRELESLSPSPQPLAPNPSAVDPENHLLWHFPYQRLDVEAIRDSMLAASGNLNRTMYGPAVFLPIQAAAVEAHTDKESAWKASAEPAIDRRTVYAYIKRTLLVPMLETLDFCDTTNSTERRAITSVAPQALTLYNGQFVKRQAEHFAARLAREAGDDSAKQIDLAFRLALARPPTNGELAAMLAFVAHEAAATDRERALIQLCRVILNLNEFVYPN